MNTYRIVIELLSNDPVDWIVPVLTEQLEGTELITYFDYTIEKDKP